MAASVFEEFSNLCSATNSCPLLNFHWTRERCFCVVRSVGQRKKFWVPMRNRGRNFIIDLFIIDLTHNRVSVAQWWSIRERNPKFWGLIPHEDSEFFLSPMLVTRQNIFLYFFADLKTNHLSYSISTELADQWEHTKTTKLLCTSQWNHLS